MLDPYEEKLLLKNIAEGSERAFRSLYDIYFDRVSAYTFKISKSEFATEEIVQDIFIKLWVNRAELTGIFSIEAYIFCMVRNKTIDYLRHLSKTSRLTGSFYQEPSMQNGVEEQLNAQELKRLIEDALTGLSEQKKKIFRLSKHDGLSHDEIAQVMHLSKSTVKNHLSETLKHIKQRIDHFPDTKALLIFLVFLSSH